MRIILLLSISCFALYLCGQTRQSAVEVTAFKEPIEMNIQLEAFRILEAKCNACHQTKNRSKIFTLANIDSFATKIHKQVFVRKRMPKGKDYTLSSEEQQTLKNWLSTLNLK